MSVHRKIIFHFQNKNMTLVPFIELKPSETNLHWDLVVKTKHNYKSHPPVEFSWQTTTLLRLWAHHLKYPIAGIFLNFSSRSESLRAITSLRLSAAPHPLWEGCGGRLSPSPPGELMWWVFLELCVHYPYLWVLTVPACLQLNQLSDTLSSPLTWSLQNDPCPGH